MVLRFLCLDCLFTSKATALKAWDFREALNGQLGTILLAYEQDKEQRSFHCIQGGCEAQVAIMGTLQPCCWYHGQFYSGLALQ